MAEEEPIDCDYVSIRTKHSDVVIDIQCLTALSEDETKKMVERIRYEMLKTIEVGGFHA